MLARTRHEVGVAGVVTFGPTGDYGHGISPRPVCLTSEADMPHLLIWLIFIVIVIAVLVVLLRRL